MKLSEVVPWGRSKHEYELMFNLSAADLSANILGCGDGPASFNAEQYAAGNSIVSVDPLYQFSGKEIEQRFEGSVDEVLAQVNANLEKFVWDYHKTPDGLLNNRRHSLQLFLQDYKQGLQQNRYQVGLLPKLAFADNQFDLALCSHFLFLYSAHFSLQFHLDAIFELLRVANEVRVFPVLTLDQQQSEYVQPITDQLSAAGYSVSLEKVAYEMQRGGDQMLKIQKL